MARTMESKRKAVIYDLHIPKTAGGTRLELLRTAYGRPNVHAIPARDWERVTKRQLAGKTAVSGHFPYGAHEYWAQEEPEYITFLRPPLERIASLYAYILMRGRAHRAYRVVSRMTPQEFAERGTFDNGMTRQLAGRCDFMWYHDKEPLSEQDLEQAKCNLGELLFVGDVAQMTADVQALSELLGWPSMTIPFVNASLGKPRLQETQALREKWRWDIALYEWYRSEYREE